VNLPENLTEGSEYQLKIDPVVKQTTNSFHKVFQFGRTDYHQGVVRYRPVSPSEGQTLTFKKDISIPMETIQAAKDLSQNTGTALGASSTVSSSLSFLAIILSADQSGATMKFSQISKLISRLRMLDLNYGDVFGTFLN
jgi:hypothetical protein